jgi:hypothetical protein
MTTTEIPELNVAELEQVSGGVRAGGGVWQECAIGTTAGGGPASIQGM